LPFKGGGKGRRFFGGKSQIGFEKGPSNIGEKGSGDHGKRAYREKKRKKHGKCKGNDGM